MSAPTYHCGMKKISAKPVKNPCHRSEKPSDVGPVAAFVRAARPSPWCQIRSNPGAAVVIALARRQ